MAAARVNRALVRSDFMRVAKREGWLSKPRHFWSSLPPSAFEPQRHLNPVVLPEESAEHSDSDGLDEISSRLGTMNLSTASPSPPASPAPPPRAFAADDLDELSSRLGTINLSSASASSTPAAPSSRPAADSLRSCSPAGPLVDEYPRSDDWETLDEEFSEAGEVETAGDRQGLSSPGSRDEELEQGDGFQSPEQLLRQVNRRRQGQHSVKQSEVRRRKKFVLYSDSDESEDLDLDTGRRGDAGPSPAGPHSPGSSTRVPGGMPASPLHFGAAMGRLAASPARLSPPAKATTAAAGPIISASRDELEDDASAGEEDEEDLSFLTTAWATNSADEDGEAEEQLSQYRKLPLNDAEDVDDSVRLTSEDEEDPEDDGEAVYLGPQALKQLEFDETNLPGMSSSSVSDVRRQRTPGKFGQPWLDPDDDELSEADDGGDDSFIVNDVGDGEEEFDTADDEEEESEALPVPPPDKSEDQAWVHPNIRINGEGVTGRAFAASRGDLARRYYTQFNQLVFGGQLPAEMDINWSGRLRTAAGMCKTRSKSDSQHIDCWIELSTAVLKSELHLRSTLLHEMCHAAVTLIDGDLKCQHGPPFRRWGKTALKITGVPVETRHNYEIEYKYRWSCVSCGKSYGRTINSIDPRRHRCGVCRGSLRALDPPPSSRAKAAPTGFAIFVQQEYAKIRAEISGDHAATMRVLSERYKQQKVATAAKQLQL